ncbi:DUF190 domain-containing protein [Chlorobium sp.]|uniref:DUF190 domain-containing protein n=1 Tax=Chlorobium sp. TaxID=1095 RepID=UPI002F41C783
MMHFIESELLRVFVGEQEKLHHRPLFELMVSEALERGMAGATVFRGYLSFGLRHNVHTAKILIWSLDCDLSGYDTGPC